MNRLKNLLTNNLALKIISVVIALMIWLVVVMWTTPLILRLTGQSRFR